jgi:anti-sigma-K factor RskA
MTTTVSDVSKEQRILISFAEETTASGFRSIYNSTNIWRVIWIVAIIAAWAFTIYQSTTLILKYLQYDTIVTVTLEVGHFVQ